MAELTDLISDDYRDLNRRLHEQDGVQFGQRGNRHYHEVVTLARDNQCETILDYGSGKGRLAKKAAIHNVSVTNYDPAVPEFSELPKPHDLVVCTDVLEHIEPEKIESVIAHLGEVTNRVAFFVIALRMDRSKNLPDGSNPHRLVRDANWWIQKLSSQFTIDFESPLYRLLPKQQFTFVAYPNGKK